MLKQIGRQISTKTGSTSITFDTGLGNNQLTTMSMISGNQRRGSKTISSPRGSYHDRRDSRDEIQRLEFGVDGLERSGFGVHGRRESIYGTDVVVKLDRGSVINEEKSSQPPVGDAWQATLRGDAERVEELIDAKHHNIDELHCVSGQSVLHLACLQGFEHIAGLLLRKGAEIDVRDVVLGETALHKAILGNHPRIVQMLLSVGASKYIQNKRGLTPIDVAKRKNLKAILHIFGTTFAHDAHKRGNHLVGDVLDAIQDDQGNQQRRKFSIFGGSDDPEMDYLAELRRMEKRYQLVNVHLFNARKETELHMESYENALELLGTKELEIQEMKHMVERMQEDLDRERDKVHQYEKRMESHRLERRKNEASVRESEELARKLEHEKLRRGEDKRLLEREKQQLEEKLRQQKGTTDRLQKQVVQIESDKDGEIDQLSNKLTEYEAKNSELQLTLQQRNNELRDAGKRIEDLMKALERETVDRRDAEEEVKTQREEIRLSHREISELRQYVRESARSQGSQR